MKYLDKTCIINCTISNVSNNDSSILSLYFCELHQSSGKATFLKIVEIYPGFLQTFKMESFEI